MYNLIISCHLMARIRRSFDIDNYILNAEISVDDDLPKKLTS